jgi:hypothetical protein
MIIEKYIQYRRADSQISIALVNKKILPMSQTIRQTNPLNEVKDQTYETTRIDLFIYDRILLYSIRSRHHCQYK